MTADDKKSTIERVSFHDNISKLNDVDFVIEVIQEILLNYIGC